MNWQPIETLPLSNYFVILCDNHGNRWLAFTDEDTKTDCGDTGYYPKYWMLAPAPPKDCK